MTALSSTRRAGSEAKSSAPVLACAMAGLLLLCGSFGWWQNHHGTVGGAISTAKTLWLFTALANFFLVPAWLWLDRSLSGPARRMYGAYFMGYAVRAVIEMPLLLWTHAWRVEHGILHNLMMVAVVMHLRCALPAGLATDAPARRFLPLLVAAAASESINAWLFGRAGSPQTGQYFANNDPIFTWINRITWMEISLLVPALIWWLAKYHHSRRPIS
jgi:hypothetical protein